MDPTRKADVDLIDVQSDFRMGPNRFAVGSARLRVERSCELYGLNLPALTGARRRVMREVAGMVEVLVDMVESANTPGTPIAAADKQPIKKQRKLIREKTEPSSPYSKAARAALFQLGCLDLCAKPEEEAAIAAAP